MIRGNDVPDHVKAAQEMLKAAKAGQSADTPPESAAVEATPTETPEAPPVEPVEAAPAEPVAQEPSELDTLKAEASALRAEKERIAAEHQKLQASHATLQGKYSAEVPRTAQELRERDERIRALEEQLAAKEQNEPLDFELSDEERELGPEVLSAAQKIAQKIAARTVKTELAKAAPPASAQPDFFATLDNILPDWERINPDPAFNAWLDERDPVFGTTRRSVLEAAHNAKDAFRAASIFRAYMAQAAKAAPAQPEPKPSAPKPSVASQVTPRTAHAVPQAKPQGRIWTLADWEEEHVKIVRQVYKPERAKEVKRELEAAMREGRVR